MLEEQDKVLLRTLIRNRAYCLRQRQRAIESGRRNLGIATYQEEEYSDTCRELIELHIVFTKLCQ
jgi:hypothetical protein